MHSFDLGFRIATLSQSEICLRHLVIVSYGQWEPWYATTVRQPERVSTEDAICKISAGVTDAVLCFGNVSNKVI